MKTYSEIYLNARRKLKDAGIEAYNLEARLIVARAADKTMEQLLRDLQLYVSDSFAERVDEMLQRRINGEPAAYIIGQWQFYSMPIDVTPDVLIPRVDTEVLAETAIKLLKKRSGSQRVLDLCAGSGCVGLAIVNSVASCRAVLVEKSLKAMSVARANTIKNNLSSRIVCIEADALKQPPVLLGKFDMIVSNPPYIRTGDLAGLDSSVKDYEPLMALDGGADGLKFYRNITEKWVQVINKGGFLVYECGAGQAKDVEEIMHARKITRTVIVKDTNGIERVVAGIID